MSTECVSVGVCAKRDVSSEGVSDQRVGSLSSHRPTVRMCVNRMCVRVVSSEGLASRFTISPAD